MAAKRCVKPGTNVGIFGSIKDSACVFSPLLLKQVLPLQEINSLAFEKKAWVLLWEQADFETIAAKSVLSLAELTRYTPPPYGGEGGGPGCGVTLVLIGFRGCVWLMFGGRKIKKTKWDSGWPSSEKSETVVPKIFTETHLHHTVKHKAVWIDGRASDSTLQTSLCYFELIPHFRQSSKFSSLETLPGSEHCFLINIRKTVAFITSRLDCCNSLSRLRLIQKLCCRN